MVRFIYFLRFNEGASDDESSSWYNDHHVPNINRLDGLKTHKSWRFFDAGIPFPSAGAPTPFDQFDRRVELTFSNLTDAMTAISRASELWVPAKNGVPGIGQIESMFLPEEPQYDLLRDVPPEQYKYMSLPLAWSGERPHVNPQEDFFVNSYCFSYTPKIPFAECEDWYLGHHTREGKQFPGMRHYKTWQVMKVEFDPSGILKPNKFERFTELGIGVDAYHSVFVNDESRIRFLASPYGNVLANWINMSIKLNDVDEFL